MLTLVYCGSWSTADREHAKQINQSLGIEGDVPKTSYRILENLCKSLILPLPRPTSQWSALHQVDRTYLPIHRPLPTSNTVVETSMVGKPLIRYTKLMGECSVCSCHIQRDTRTLPFPLRHPNPIHRKTLACENWKTLEARLQCILLYYFQSG